MSTNFICPQVIISAMYIVDIQFISFNIYTVNYISFILLHYDEDIFNSRECMICIRSDLWPPSIKKYLLPFKTTAKRHWARFLKSKLCDDLDGTKQFDYTFRPSTGSVETTSIQKSIQFWHYQCLIRLMI